MAGPVQHRPSGPYRSVAGTVSVSQSTQGLGRPRRHRAGRPRRAENAETLRHPDQLDGGRESLQWGQSSPAGCAAAPRRSPSTGGGGPGAGASGCPGIRSVACPSARGPSANRQARGAACQPSKQPRGGIPLAGPQTTPRVSEFPGGRAQRRRRAPRRAQRKSRLSNHTHPQADPYLLRAQGKRRGRRHGHARALYVLVRAAFFAADAPKAASAPVNRWMGCSTRRQAVGTRDADTLTLRTQKRAHTRACRGCI